MNNDSINFTISGITKIMIPIAAIFLIKTTKEVVCKWLESCEKCKCSDIVVPTVEQVITDSESIESIESSELNEVNNVNESSKVNTKNKVKIVDNYHKKLISAED